MDLSKIQVFSKSDLEIDSRFSKVLKSAMPTVAAREGVETSIYWGASALGLDRVDLFNSLAPEARQSVLQQCTADLMRETCFIEMAGLSYTARMSLEAKSLEERLFYSVMASEEARHFSMLQPFANPAILATGPDSFTSLIGEMIVEAEREQVIFLIQVLLEGWGLTHFSWMASHCENESLRLVLKSILKDEARHHAAGLALSKRAIGRGDKKVVAWLESILGLVQRGPVRVLQALEDHSGPLSQACRVQTLFEIEAESSVMENLLRLRSLLDQHVEISVLKRFEEKRLFEPAL
jgi:tRNA isopentenyl-2-thiomethyl-A-37 hydroxylase MiaE